MTQKEVSTMLKLKLIGLAAAIMVISAVFTSVVLAQTATPMPTATPLTTMEPDASPTPDAPPNTGLGGSY
jgi:hypothetical protein